MAYKNPSLRRIQADIRELLRDPSPNYMASPLETDMFQWHFTLRGPPKTSFSNGIYHGMILLPPTYPFKPPNIIFLTPNGRFDVGVKICLSISAHHPEHWQPAWGIRLILEALISFFPTPFDGAIGALDWTDVERKRLAVKSLDFCCTQCGEVRGVLLPVDEAKAGKGEGEVGKYASEIAKLHLHSVGNGVVMSDGGDAGDDSKSLSSSSSKIATALSTVNSTSTSTTKKEKDDDTVTPALISPQLSKPVYIVPDSSIPLLDDGDGGDSPIKPALSTSLAASASASVSPVLPLQAMKSKPTPKASKKATPTSPIIKSTTTTPAPTPTPNSTTATSPPSTATNANVQTQQQQQHPKQVSFANDYLLHFLILLSAIIFILVGKKIKVFYEDLDDFLVNSGSSGGFRR